MGRLAESRLAADCSRGCAIVARLLHDQQHPTSERRRHETLCSRDHLFLAGRLSHLLFGSPALALSKAPPWISAARYAAQLGAYAFALQNPATDARYAPTLVDATALLIFRPVSFMAKPSGIAGLFGRTVWIEVPQSVPKFLATLERVATLLAGAAMPAISTCSYPASSL